jgi:hypothetical protein
MGSLREKWHGGDVAATMDAGDSGHGGVVVSIGDVEKV